MVNPTTNKWMFAWSSKAKKIEEGSCKVGIITFSDLEEAEKITVGNALRGEIDAVLSH